MSYYTNIQDLLQRAELAAGDFELDRLAFVVSHAHRAQVVAGERLLGDLPKLKAHFDDCLAQDSAPINRHRFLLSIADHIDDDDVHGRLCDQLRKFAQDGRY